MSSLSPSTPSQQARTTFVGEVWRDVVIPPTDNISVGNNFFAPGSRTNWHAHPEGQLLIIQAGEGFVADEDGPVAVRAGDVIWTPPRTRHWHGATATRYLLHTAVTIGGVEWAEAVPDEIFALAHDVLSESPEHQS